MVVRDRVRQNHPHHGQFKPRPVCYPPLKAYSPVRERTLPRGTTAGSGGSYSVGKSGRNYFSAHNKQLYERNKASARGRYMGDFQEREQDNQVEIEMVRPDTPPTPGGPGSEENTTILVTLETTVEGPATPPTPGDTSLKLRAVTPPTPGTPVVWDLFESLPGSPNNLFSPPTPGRGEGGDTGQGLLFRQRKCKTHPLRLDERSRRLTGWRNLSQSWKSVTPPWRSLWQTVTNVKPGRLLRHTNRWTRRKGSRV